jgi:hypothetical protein
MLFLFLQFVAPTVSHWWAVRQIYSSGGAVLFQDDYEPQSGNIYSDLSIANAAAAVLIVHVRSDAEAIAVAEQLKHLPEAKQVFFDGAVTDVGLTAICNSGPHPSLEIFDFASTPITAAGLARIKNLPRLHTLFFNTCPIRDADLTTLKLLTNVRNLTLLEEAQQANPGRFTDRGFVEIGKAEQLESLLLVNLNISDRAAGYLHSLLTLKSLRIIRCQISDEAVMSLRHALPSCQIEAFKNRNLVSGEP